MQKTRIYLAGFPTATEQQKLRALSGFLNKDAWHRYQTLLTEYPEGGVTPLTVDLVLTDFVEHFADQNLAAKSRWALNHAKQYPSETVMQFSNRIDRLLAVPGLEDLASNKKHVLEVFLSGLPLPIHEMLLSQIRFLHDKAAAVTAAVDAEQDLQRRAKRKDRTDPAEAKAKARLTAIEAELEAVKAEAHAAHLAAMGTQGKPQKTASSSQPQLVAGTDGKTYKNIRCYRCRRLGHYRQQCPKNRQPGNG